MILIAPNMTTSLPPQRELRGDSIQVIGSTQWQMIKRARASKGRLIIPNTETQLKSCRRLQARGLFASYRFGSREIGHVRAFQLTSYSDLCWLVVFQ